jgi:hypothetical protein
VQSSSFFSILLIGRGPFVLATGILPEKEPVHFHFMHTVKAAEPESIRQPAQRRRKNGKDPILTRRFFA